MVPPHQYFRYKLIGNWSVHWTKFPFENLSVEMALAFSAPQHPKDVRNHLTKPRTLKWTTSIPVMVSVYGCRSHFHRFHYRPVSSFSFFIFPRRVHVLLFQRFFFTDGHLSGLLSCCLPSLFITAPPAHVNQASTFALFDHKPPLKVLIYNDTFRSFRAFCGSKAFFVRIDKSLFSVLLLWFLTYIGSSCFGGVKTWEIEVFLRRCTPRKMKRVLFNSGVAPRSRGCNRLFSPSFILVADYSDHRVWWSK